MTQRRQRTIDETIRHVEAWTEGRKDTDGIVIEVGKVRALLAEIAQLRERVPQEGTSV